MQYHCYQCDEVLPDLPASPPSALRGIPARTRFSLCHACRRELNRAVEVACREIETEWCARIVRLASRSRVRIVLEILGYAVILGLGMLGVWAVLR